MSKWDRPPDPRDWRFWVGGVGKTLIAIGVLMFGFVAYQLWGTGIETARAQNSLENEFEQLLAETPETTPPVSTAPVTVPPSTPATDSTLPDASTAPPTTAPPTTAPPTTAVPVEQQNLPVFQEGDAIARLEIPKIGVDDIVVAGVAKNDLKKGPGHYPETPMPGQLGNSAIAGHRTTYGQPFFNVDQLAPGDQIIVTTPSGRFVYDVTGQQIVAASDYQVVATTDPTVATITLTSCHPRWTARERIVISGVLDQAASAQVGEPIINYGRPLDTAPADTSSDGTDTAVAPATSIDEPTVTSAAPATTQPAGAEPAEPAPTTVATDPATPALGSAEVNAGIADAFADGWFSDPGANSQVALWGLLLAAIGVLSYLISRKFKRDWVGLMAGIIPFIVVLYFFFQNVNRLLPPNL